MTQVLIDTKVVEQVIAAMGCVGADIVCQASHHSKKDEHDGLRHCPVGERWHKAFDELRAALANAERVEPDTQRLDFMFLYDAFLSRTKTDADTIAYQLLAQNEDEDYVVLSGEDKFFPTGRAAVDAAREKDTP